VLDRPADGNARTGARALPADLGAAVLDALPSPTVLLDSDGTVLLANAAWSTAMAGRPPSGTAIRAGDNYFEQALRVRDDDGARSVLASLRELSRGEGTVVAVDFAVPAGDDTTRWLHVQASRVDPTGRLVVTHTDITARVRAEQSLVWQARHDHLTELPNRAHLHELIDAELQRPDRSAVTVLFLDVDGFKDVNDSLGHEVGDELLRQLSARLTGRTRSEDTVGRLGGDEFVVLCRDCDAEGAQMLASRCQSAFDQPFPLGGRSIRLSSSIGIATAPPGDPALRSTDLVRDADLAMYAAKAAGRNRVRVFSPDLRYAVQEKVLVAAELRDAVETGQFVLHYQPIVHLPSGAVQGVEALVRWLHPERGLIPPGDWLALAEQHELMGQLTRWVLGSATAQAAEWGRQGLPLVMSVNAGAVSLASASLVPDVREALDRSGLPPERLVMELPERSVAEDPTGAASQFAELRVFGVEVAIDDFGSGFSSLSQLVTIPAGMLKIDRSLVAGTGGPASRGAAAIAAVVGLARACGMRCLAQGVETPEQLALVRELGCTYAQGEQIAGPMPADELAGWLAGRDTPPVRGRVLVSR
jgi:diguanylate cyclase (GGDEF)-like protein